jgi:CDP-diacylglycerol---glycerol-3-phosphate 3-phosphatidyltransferase
VAITTFHRRPDVRTYFLTAGTGLRIVAVPVVMALVLDDGIDHWVPFAVFIVAALTDYLDGYFARRWQVTTTLGSFLDTTADKLLATGALIALVSVDRASAWVAALVIGREMLILGLRGVVAADGTVMKASSLARWKTTLQFIAIPGAILRPDWVVAGQYADEWLMVAAAIITALSAADYLVKFASTLSIEHD